jgi:hypothetical protein
MFLSHVLGDSLSEFFGSAWLRRLSEHGAMNILRRVAIGTPHDGDRDLPLSGL